MGKTLETDMRPSAHNYCYLLTRRWFQLAMLPFVPHVGLISGTISWVVCKVNWQIHWPAHIPVVFFLWRTKPVTQRGREKNEGERIKRFKIPWRFNNPKIWFPRKTHKKVNKVVAVWSQTGVRHRTLSVPITKVKIPHPSSLSGSSSLIWERSVFILFRVNEAGPQRKSYLFYLNVIEMLVSSRSTLRDTPRIIFTTDLRNQYKVT